MSSKSRRVVRDRKYVRPGDSQPKSRAQVVRRFPDNVNLFKLKELVLGITTFSAGDQYLASLSGQQVAFLYHVGSDAFNSSDIELSDSIPVTSLPRNCKLVLDLENVVGGVTADEFREIFATLTRDDSWGEYQLPSTEGGPVCNGYRVQDNSKPIEVERQLPIRTVDLGVAHVLKKYVRGSAAIARHTSPPIIIVYNPAYMSDETKFDVNVFLQSGQDINKVAEDFSWLGLDLSITTSYPSVITTEVMHAIPESISVHAGILRTAGDNDIALLENSLSSEIPYTEGRKYNAKVVTAHLFGVSRADVDMEYQALWSPRLEKLVYEVFRLS